MSPRSKFAVFLIVNVSLILLASLMIWVENSLGVRSFARVGETPLSGFPRIVLWVWERPEHISFIDPSKVGIAFLAKTIDLEGGIVITRPRLHPFSAPAKTPLIAVVRIESGLNIPPTLSQSQVTETVQAISDLAEIKGIHAIQIDFDARRSERDFYRSVLEGVRQHLPRSISLSITALASWCLHDQWIDTLHIDEAVPMLFRMGPESNSVHLHLNSGGDFQPAVCRESIGISTDEPLHRHFPGRRTYIFNPQPWVGSPPESLLREMRHP